MKIRSLTFLLVTGLVAMPGQAKDIGPELQKCRAIDSLAYRLQCYDQLVDGLGQSGVSTVLPEPVVAPTAPTVAAPSAPRTTTPAETGNVSTPVTQSVAPQQRSSQVSQAEALFGKGEEAVKKELEVDSIDQIASEVTQVRVAPDKAYVVYLENGQVWRQKDKIGQWRIKVGERAIITKATLGSYLMKSDARKRSVRAERLR